MRVLLVATNRMTTPFPVYPIGIDHVATALRGRHEVRILDLACAGAEAALAQACQEFRPEVVGLSLRNICTPTPSATWCRRGSHGRRHRVVGSGGASTATRIKRMYQRGQVGPLWDKLVPG